MWALAPWTCAWLVFVAIQAWLIEADPRDV